MPKLSVTDVELKGKKVLVRVDFNVPLSEDGKKVEDDTRIVAALPTIKHVLEKGGRLILMSHLGRPKGQVKDNLRLGPIAERLAALLGQPVGMAPDCVGEEVEKLASSLGEGEVLLLENLRFHREETKNDPGFAEKLAGLGDVYINDAFGTMHRAHASTEGVTKHLEKCAAGLLVAKELDSFSRALDAPEKPFVAILGGAKVSDKIGVIENLLDKVDVLVIGGGMAYTFEKAQGHAIGASLVEDDKLDLARELLEKAKEKGVTMVLPTDHVIADEFKADAQTKTVEVGQIPEGWQGLDIGPKTIKAFKAAIAGAKTIVWNGPVGVFEMAPFAGGTRELARAVAESGAVSVIGGGDSARAVKEAGVAERMTHISTGGGASLELLEGRLLPGVAALTDK